MPWESCEENVEVEKPERTLVLLGRTGNGKSATGNTILGERKFKSLGRGKSITQKCELHSSKLPNGQTVNVIDTPGLFSASSTTAFTAKEIVRCLHLARDRIDAVLLVLSARGRFTEEEVSTLRTLKILFGDQVVDYMIVVFTNGDRFDDEEEGTLDNYLEDCPELEEIIKECGGRKVLFDNTKNAPKSRKHKQVQDLLNLVQQISYNNNGKSFMADFFLELREHDATFEEKQKQIEATEGSSSKQDIAQKYSYNERLKELEEKIFSQLNESLRDVKDKLAQTNAAREEIQKKLNEIQKLSSDEIGMLREQLKKAQRETASLRTELSKKCSIL